MTDSGPLTRSSAAYGSQPAAGASRSGVPQGSAAADYPFDMGVTDPVERATAAALPAADLTAILSGNAAALLGLTATAYRR